MRSVVSGICAFPCRVPAWMLRAARAWRWALLIGLIGVGGVAEARGPWIAPRWFMEMKEDRPDFADPCWRCWAVKGRTDGASVAAEELVPCRMGGHFSRRIRWRIEANDERGRICWFLILPPGFTLQFFVYSHDGRAIPYCARGYGFADDLRDFSDDEAIRVIRESDRLLYDASFFCYTLAERLPDSAAVICSDDGRSVPVPYGRSRFYFIDEQPGSPWPHCCRYVFFNEDMNEFVMYYQSRPPLILNRGRVERMALCKVRRGIPWRRDASMSILMKMDRSTLTLWTVAVFTLFFLVALVWQIVCCQRKIAKRATADVHGICAICGRRPGEEQEKVYLLRRNKGTRLWRKDACTRIFVKVPLCLDCKRQTLVKGLVIALAGELIACALIATFRALTVVYPAVFVADAVDVVAACGLLLALVPCSLYLCRFKLRLQKHPKVVALIQEGFAVLDHADFRILYRDYDEIADKSALAMSVADQRVTQTMEIWWPVFCVVLVAFSVFAGSAFDYSSPTLAEMAGFLTGGGSGNPVALVWFGVMFLFSCLSPLLAVRALRIDRVVRKAKFLSAVLAALALALCVASEAVLPGMAKDLIAGQGGVGGGALDGLTRSWPALLNGVGGFALSTLLMLLPSMFGLLLIVTLKRKWRLGKLVCDTKELVPVCLWVSIALAQVCVLGLAILRWALA